MITFSHVFIEELLKNINPALIQYYSEHEGQSKFFSQSLHEIVQNLVQSELSGSAEKEELKLVYAKKMKLRLQKKTRYLKKCSDMIDTKEYLSDSDKYFLRATLIQYNMTPEDKRDLIFEGKSIQDKEQEKFLEIKTWADNSDTLMIDYPGEEKLTSSTIIDNYKSDLIIDICYIIKQLYDFDLNRATYAVMEDFKNQPLFAAQPGRISVSNLNLEGNPKELIIYKSEDHNKKLVVTLPDKAINEAGEFQILDQTDNMILSYLLSRWDNKSPSMNVYSIKIIDVLKYIKPKRKKFGTSDYDSVAARIARMYEIGIKGIDKKSVTEGMHIISSFRYDKATRIITYAFDPFYMDKFHNLRIRKMSSKPLSELTNNAAKILYSSFMEQRHNAYKRFNERGENPDEYIIALEYNYLLYWCNFGELNKKRSYHEDIMEALDDFKQHNVMVKDYVYLPTRKIYKITFFPLSDDEIKDFDYYYNIKASVDETLDEDTQLNLFIPTIED